MDQRTPADKDPIEVLNRWERAGGVWRVTSQRPELVVVAMMRCDAGEVVEELTSSDASWISYLSQHPSSDA